MAHRGAVLPQRHIGVKSCGQLPPKGFDLPGKLG
jgi:hypothetical protein